ncbi:unnamed protein product [Mytilus coruscus]|uniref:Uncharacterized protein n=1 Tax=Mytilus coruscus TaxID=42192 RepID=A0A6J8AZ77_MYTCO|nr:unnamed protein product [Mytilus coruscus]
MTTQEQPLVTVLKDDRKLSCTPHKDPACTKGAEGQLSANYAGMETSTRYRIGKITLDLPQKTFLFEVEKENSFILVYSDKLDPYKLIEKEKEPTFYDAIKRSHDHWLDVRDKRNFLYSEEHSQNFVTQYSKWYNIQDRGGLQKPCDTLFLLVRKMELIVRKTTSTVLSANSLLTEPLMENIMESFMIKYYCNILMANEEGSIVSAVTEDIIRLFLRIRGFAVTRLERNKTSKSTKKSS